MRVLVIDDSKDITEVVRYYCESKQIKCHTANSAAEGLALINNNKFDLVLLDLAMPEVTGWAVAIKRGAKVIMKFLRKHLV
jgi:DNA-binding response OmpR family regulator